MRRCLLVLLGVAVSAGASVLRPRTQQSEDTLATTENGVVRGEVATSLNGTPYKRFVGIPYATPPIGDLRFRAPLPAVNWSGVRDTLEFGPTCLQQWRGSEDCLYLNVYVPLSNGSSPLAVMFYIYGGSFTLGSSTDKAPDYFMENGVLLVTINYRLGPFGFLSLQNDEIPGNAGLKDQVFALQWVQRNIEAFGGDPTKVTIFGESAGGVSASFLFLSPATKGLFQGAMMESGVATTPWAVQHSPRDIAAQLGTALGFLPRGDNVTEEDARLAAFLRAANAGDLLAAQVQSGDSGLPYAPVLEPWSDSAVITEMPEDILKEGRYNQVPFVAGVTSGEASLFTIIFLLNTTVAREMFLGLVAGQIPRPTVEEQIEAAKQVENFYFGAGGFNVSNTQAISDVFTDILFIWPAYSFARTVLNTSSLPVHFYYFDYDGYGSTANGMNHAMETVYLFPALFGPDKDPASNDWKVTQQLLQLWTDFGKYGNPTPDGSSMSWERFTADTDSYLDMKVDFVTRQHFLQGRMALWRDLMNF